MRKVILLLSLLVSISVSAQKESKTQNLFVRVFGMDGKKIGKGHIYSINDSILVLSRNEKATDLYLKDIGKIKTKRSGGHNVLIGAASGAVLGSILGLVNPPTDSSPGTFTWAGGSSGDEFTSGLTAGLLSGTIIGGISALFKNSQTFIIQANPDYWNVFVEEVKPFAKSKS
ncbi:hypothetical protein [Gramella sp. KN1008]|uniref:hypothetical protein n=1 Tax=Gramella sp. KN1008 TaxID=2529298 RepID=UPI00103A02C3|nr:hypothetical protein [Gramella sp. KN1008]TBW29973.1 hypothetical protein EZJ28_00785 [Gramella sp. KN1008]